MSFYYNNNGKIDSDDFRYDDDGGSGGNGGCLTTLLCMGVVILIMAFAGGPAIIVSGLVEEALDASEFIVDLVFFIVWSVLFMGVMLLVYMLIDWIKGKNK